MHEDKDNAAAPQNTPDGEAPRLRPGRRFRDADTPFNAWLEESGKMAVDVAQAAGVSISTIYGIRKGTQRVSIELAAKLIKISGGALTVESFLTEADRAALADVPDAIL